MDTTYLREDELTVYRVYKDEPVNPTFVLLRLIEERKKNAELEERLDACLNFDDRDIKPPPGKLIGHIRGTFVPTPPKEDK